MTTHNMAWEDVLAEVEADVRATEAALATSAADFGVRRELAPAETMLPFGTSGTPGAGATGPYLPPLSGMPPVPSELLERIVELRNRIEALRMKMQAEMVELQAATARIAAQRPVAAVASAAPRFVDCAL